MGPAGKTAPRAQMPSRWGTVRLLLLEHRRVRGTIDPGLRIDTANGSVGGNVMETDIIQEVMTATGEDHDHGRLGAATEKVIKTAIATSIGIGGKGIPHGSGIDTIMISVGE